MIKIKELQKIMFEAYLGCIRGLLVLLITFQPSSRLASKYKDAIDRTRITFLKNGAEKHYKTIRGGGEVLRNGELTLKY